MADPPGALGGRQLSVPIPVVRERGRTLAPAAIVAQALIFAAMGPLGIEPPARLLTRADEVIE